MKELTVKFSGIKDVYEFTKLASKESSDIELVRGNQTVNAKSILGVLMFGTEKSKMKWNGELNVDNFKKFIVNS